MTEWLEYTTDWGYWVNPDTFRTPTIKKSVRVGAVVLLKGWEDLDDGRRVVVTTYGVVEVSDIKEMGKKDVSKVLALQMLDFMQTHKMYPPKTEIKKSYANGNVDLGYSPSEYDSFTIRFTPDIVGGKVEDFLFDLEKFTEETNETGEAWKVEPAKSNRSKCRTCEQKIQKGELRLGKPSLFESHVSYGWHHMKCASYVLKGVTLDTLEGYENLNDTQKQELQDVA